MEREGEREENTICYGGTAGGREEAFVIRSGAEIASKKKREVLRGGDMYSRRCWQR
jgi:hypothetical protein